MGATGSGFLITVYLDDLLKELLYLTSIGPQRLGPNQTCDT